jgi:hypothetical protein
MAQAPETVEALEIFDKYSSWIPGVMHPLWVEDSG